MSEKCVIITGGTCNIKPVVMENDFVIACDYGYEYCVKYGIKVDLVVGDFDSYNGDISEISNCEILKFEKEKDDTDTMIAIKYCVDNNIKIVDIYGALGGRFDHQYANVQSLVFACKNGIFCKIIDENNILYAIYNDEITLEKIEGYSISIFSYTDQSYKVNSDGLKYPLYDLTLDSHFPLGVSNEFTKNIARISVGDGIILAILSKIS